MLATFATGCDFIRSIDPKDSPIDTELQAVLEKQTALARHDIYPRVCNGIDSITHDTTYVSAWTIMAFQPRISSALANKSNDSLDFSIQPSDSIGPGPIAMRFQYAIIGMDSASVRHIRLVRMNSAAPLSRSDSTIGYLDLRRDTTFALETCPPLDSSPAP